MAATILKPNPASVPGAGMKEVLNRAVYPAFGPAITFDTAVYTSTGAVEVELFDVFPGVSIVGFQMIQTTAWDGTGNQFTAGDSDDVDRFLDTTTWLSTDLGANWCADTTGLNFQYQSSDPHTIKAYVQVSTGTTAGATQPVLWFSEDPLD